MRDFFGKDYSGEDEELDLFGVDPIVAAPAGFTGAAALGAATERVFWTMHWYDWLNPRYWLDHHEWVADRIEPGERAKYLAATAMHGDFGADDFGETDTIQSDPVLMHMTHDAKSHLGSLLDLLTPTQQAGLSPQQANLLAHSYPNDPW